MSFLLGSMTDGMFGGIKAAASMYDLYTAAYQQGIQTKAHQVVAAAANDPSNQAEPGYTPIDTTDTSGAQTSPAGQQSTGAGLDGSGTTSNGPVADVSKVNWTPDSQKPAAAPQSGSSGNTSGKQPSGKRPSAIDTLAKAIGPADKGGDTADDSDTRSAQDATSATGGLGRDALSALPQGTTSSQASDTSSGQQQPTNYGRGLTNPDQQPAPTDTPVGRTNPTQTTQVAPGVTAPAAAPAPTQTAAGGPGATYGRGLTVPAAAAPTAVVGGPPRMAPQPVPTSTADDNTRTGQADNSQSGQGQTDIGATIMNALVPPAQGAENPNGAPMSANQALRPVPSGAPAAAPAPAPQGAIPAPAAAAAPSGGLGPVASGAVAALRAQQAGQPGQQGQQAANPFPAPQAPPPQALTQPTAPASGGPNATTPPVVPAPPKGTVPPADAGATVVLPTNVAKVVPAQVGPTTQSEPAPTYTVPPFDPRPYVALCEQNPKVRQLVDNIAAQEHIDPARLAWHWNQESKFSTDLTMRGKAGEVGPLQLLPGTMDQIDPGHTVDRNTLQGQLTLAARNIHVLDTRYGQDTPLSFAAYQGGTGSADAIQAGEGRYHPDTVAYMAAAFPGQRIDSSTMPPPLEVDPVAAIKAGTAGGPDGFIHYVAQTGATGQQMSPKWRAAETALVSLAAYRGDIDGMRHAQDFVLQMSQQGTNMALQQAYQALTVGNGTVAAQALARAHAFFPDGTIARFGVDKDGNVWGIQVDENNPNQTIGNHFQVRPQDVQQLLVQTLDPNQFRQMVTEQQQANAVIRSTNAHGDYYLNLIQERATAAQDAVNERYFQADQNNKTRALIAQEADATRQQTAQLAEQGQRDKGVAAQALKLGSSSAFERGDATPKDIDKEVANTFRQDGTDPTTANWGPGQYDMAASVYSDLRLNSPSGSMNPVSATSVSKGVINGDYLIRPTIGGKYAVIPRATPNGPPRAILSGSVGARLYSAMMGAPKPAALPAVGRLMPAGGGSAVPMQPQQQQAIAR